MPEINIDGKPYQVEDGINLLEACQSLKLELPYFCWHPALGSVGSCRQCAVTLFQNEEDTRGRITMACMTPVAEGQRLSLNDPKAEKFRASLIEATMTNHPHDCPVCEEAGECNLQDMTLMSGHIDRRFQGPKRTHDNQYLGPFINHEMNRCIACYRCVRFYRDYSGGTDLNVFASRNRVYFGRAEEGVLENEFSGNLAEVCPTGVFTDKTYSQHYSRKWELQSAPSICVHCSVGCNIYPGERQGTLRRITNRFNPDINGHFICDRGRFGYEFVNHKDKTTHAWQRNYDTQSTNQLPAKDAQASLQKFLSHAKNSNSIIAIGSSRSSLENNFTLRALVGEDNFYSDAKKAEQLQLNSLLNHYQHVQNSSSLKELEAGDMALMIGDDVTQTAPRIALSLRQLSKNAGKDKAATLGVKYWSAAEVQNIAQELKSPIHIISSHSTRLDDIATSATRLQGMEQIKLIQRISHFLNSENESAENDIDKHAKQIASELKRAEKPFIVTSVSLIEPALLNATLQLSQSLHQLNKNAGLICASPHANSLGLLLLTNPVNSIENVFERIEQLSEKGESLDTLIILETDLYRYCEAEKLETLLNKVKNIIVLDHLLTPTAEQADLLLPTTSFAEQHGSWVNYEGRVQASVSCFSSSDDRRPAHEWISNSTQFHSLLKDLAGMRECFKNLPSLYKQPFDKSSSDDFSTARKMLRSSGRTALNAFIDIKEIPPDSDADSPYQYSQEGLHSSATDTTPAHIWVPGWNSNEALSNFQQEVNGPIQGSHPGILLFSPIHEIPDLAESIGSIERPELVEKQGLANGSLYALPYHHIFADDELSSYVSSIQRQTPEPCVRINSQQAKIMSFEEGDYLGISIGNIKQAQLLLTIDESTPDNVALLPALLLQRASLESSNVGAIKHVFLSLHADSREEDKNNA